MPGLKDDPKERPRKLANQKYEWKLLTNYKKNLKATKKKQHTRML